MQDSVVFAGTKANGIFVSTDFGTTWNVSSNGLPAQPDIRCLYVYQHQVFTGTGAGEIFASNNFGGNWFSIGDSLEGAPVLSLYASGGWLYAGMNAGGVWKRPLSEITGNQETVNNASFSVYPNPADNLLFIEIPSASERTTLEIYTIKGEVILTKKVDAGIKTLDIHDWAPGIYLVKVYDDLFNSTRKILKQ